MLRHEREKHGKTLSGSRRTVRSTVSQNEYELSPAIEPYEAYPPEQTYEEETDQSSLQASHHIPQSSYIVSVEKLNPSGSSKDEESIDFQQCIEFKSERIDSQPDMERIIYQDIDQIQAQQFNLSMPQEVRGKVYDVSFENEEESFKCEPS